LVLVPVTGVFQQTDQGLELVATEVSQLLLVQLGDDGVQPGEQVLALPGDACTNEAPVLSLPASNYKPGILQPIEEPGGIRDPCHKAVTDFVTAETGRTGAA
jgi:hypothetical protein